jgi:hypothetical protein
VSIPCGDEVKTGFAYDLSNLMCATCLSRDDVELRLHTLKGTILSKSREELAFMALEHDYTHLMFLDSDMRFPRNALLRLLARDTYVIGANYATRRYPVRPVTFADDEDASKRVFTEEGADGVEQVASIGMGCALIDLDVFRALPRPWFAMPWDEKARAFIGEDVYFCRKVRQELDLPILVDHGLSQEIAHVGEWEYRLDHARALRDEAPQNTPVAPLVVAS